MEGGGWVGGRLFVREEEEEGRGRVFVCLWETVCLWLGGWETVCLSVPFHIPPASVFVCLLTCLNTMLSTSVLGLTFFLFLSSMGMDVAGRVVEVISGTTLDVYFDENIFRPLGMTSTKFWEVRCSRALRSPYFFLS